MDFEAIDAARKTLDLDAHATLEEVRSAYKKLAAECHPDRFASAPEADRAAAEDRFKQISHANDLITRYVERYCYSFKDDDVRRALMDPAVRAHLKRYYDGQYGSLDI